MSCCARRPRTPGGRCPGRRPARASCRSRSTPMACSVDARGRGDPGGAPRRLLFANPTGNNATGTVLSDERRARLAALSAESGLVIIEDDTGAELIHDDGPVPAPIASFDPEAPVILVKSYAKTVLPGLRLGVILPPPHPRPARAGGQAGRRPLHVAPARPRPGRLPGPARGGPQPRAHAAAVPRSPRRVPALARAPPGRPRHVARAARRLQPVAAPARPRSPRRRSSRAASSAA